MNIWVIAILATLILLGTALFRIKVLTMKLRNADIIKARLFRRSSEFLLILDNNLIVREVSRAVLQRFRMEPDAVLGRHIDKTILWPESETGRKSSLLAMCKALNGEPSIFSYNRSDLNGRKFSLEIKIFPVPSPEIGKQDIFCVARDITAELDTKRRLSRRVTVEEIIAEISSSALAAVDLKSCVPGIMESAGVFLNARRAFFLQTDRNKNIVWGSIWSAPGTSKLDAGLAGLNVDAMMPFGIDSGFVRINNIPDNPLIPEKERIQATEAGVGSLILNSIVDSEGTIFGYAGFTFHRPDAPEDKSTELLLKMLATTLTGLLTRIEAHKEMELFRQSVEAAGQGIVLIDTDGFLVYTNAAYSELTGRKASSSDPVWNTYSGSFKEKVRLLVLPLLQTGEKWTGELQIRNDNGKIIDTIESFHPIYTGGEKPGFFVNIITEITERKRLEGKLISARNEAEQANRAKSNYLANMSHEIRTPMNAVIGLTYLALQTPLNPRQQDYLTKINASAKNLLAIINDILDLSKIESGRLELEAGEFSLDEVIDNLADMLVDKAWEKNLKLLVFRSPKVRDRRIGDKFRLGQVLLNLLGNAVKFTSSGTVELRVESGDPGFVTFVVEDTGIGMNEEQIGRLFSPFTQADASTSRKFGGTGLGLTISKQIVELMGGMIEVESSPDRGSRFKFSIRSDPGLVSMERSVAGKSAIIVSDDSTTGGFHRQQLESAGLYITCCSSVKEALECPEKAHILLFDLDAIKSNQEKAIHALSTDTEDDFILILSGSMSSAELSSFAPRGIKTVVLPVPYSRSRLLDSLSRPGVTIPEKSSGSLTIRGRVLLADDNEINLQVGKELISRVGLAVDVATNGIEAVKACEERSYDLVFLDLHMPEMDGYEALSKIRLNNPDLPVIALTASALSDVKLRIREAGFSNYIAKPIEPDNLYRLIGEVLSVPVSALRAITQAEVSVIEKIPEIDGLIVERGLRGVLGDRGKYREMLRRFNAEHLNDVSKIRTAIVSNDYSQAVSLIHFLKGSAGQIGAVKLHDITGGLEEMLRNRHEPGENDLNSLFSVLEKLISDIELFLGSYDRQDVSQLLNELEVLIRKSDRRSRIFMQEQFADPSASPEAEYIKDIKEALDKWDFNLALEAVEDWRASMGDLIE